MRSNGAAPNLKHYQSLSIDQYEPYRDGTPRTDFSLRFAVEQWLNTVTPTATATTEPIISTDDAMLYPTDTEADGDDDTALSNNSCSSRTDSLLLHLL